MGRGFIRTLFVFLFAALSARAVSAAEPSAADFSTREGFGWSAAQVASGLRLETGICPCVRWSVAVRTLAGQWETRHFILSSEGLAQLRFDAPPDFQRIQQATLQAGAVELLWKQGHIGLGFMGVEIGQDRDRGLSEIFRTGLYALLNVLRHSDAPSESDVRLDLRTEWFTPGYRINRGPEIRRHQIRESIVFDWHAGRFSGGLRASGGIDLTGWQEGPVWDLRGQTHARFEILRLGAQSVGVNIAAFASHDTFQELFGFPADAVGGSIYFDAAWLTPAQGEPGDPGVWRWW